MVVRMEKNMSAKYWGYHLAIDAPGASLDYIRNSQRISDFAKDLVKRIDMVAYGEPVVVHFGSGNKAGYTMYQLIETSNICAHFVEEDGHGTGKGSYYLDVFSCKPFEKETVINCAREYFGNNSEIVHYMDRDAYAASIGSKAVNAETVVDGSEVNVQPTKSIENDVSVSIFDALDFGKN